MIAKSIEGSNTKTSPKKLWLHCGVYEWTDSGGLINNDGPTLCYRILKSSTQLQLLVFQTYNIKLRNQLYLSL